MLGSFFFCFMKGTLVAPTASTIQENKLKIPMRIYIKNISLCICSYEYIKM